jgi:membrane protease YdiL (CAAX protease family)
VGDDDRGCGADASELMTAADRESVARETPSVKPGRGRHPLWIAAIVTVVVTALSYGVPDDYAATAVGAAFLFAVWALVLRGETESVRHFGLSLGGVLENRPLDPKRVFRDTGTALAWALGLLAVIVPPFVLGFQIYRRTAGPFHFVPPASIADEIFGQALVIALPEEAFYRGYLMTALDDLWGTPWTIAKAKLGWGWIVSSALFAVGHALTITNVERLAVFFPALVFGWLRARTRGIGASSIFHVLCNVLASTLERGYGIGAS